MREPEEAMKRKPKKKNGWEYNSGLFEIYWENDVATHVKVNGSLFHAAHRVNLKPERRRKSMTDERNPQDPIAKQIEVALPCTHWSLCRISIDDGHNQNCPAFRRPAVRALITSHIASQLAGAANHRPCPYCHDEDIENCGCWCHKAKANGWLAGAVPQAQTNDWNANQETGVEVLSDTEDCMCATHVRMRERRQQLEERVANAVEAEHIRCLRVVEQQITSSTGPTGGWLDSPKAVLASIALYMLNKVNHD